VARTKGGTEGKTTLDELTTFAEETLLEDFELLELLDRTLLEELFPPLGKLRIFRQKILGCWNCSTERCWKSSNQQGHQKQDCCTQTKALHRPRALPR